MLIVGRGGISDVISSNNFSYNQSLLDIIIQFIFYSRSVSHLPIWILNNSLAREGEY